MRWAFLLVSVPGAAVLLASAASSSGAQDPACQFPESPYEYWSGRGVRLHDNGTKYTVPEGEEFDFKVTERCVDGLTEGQIIHRYPWEWLEQHTVEVLRKSDEDAKERRKEVVKAIEFVWFAYTKKAWNADEIRPISGQPKNDFLDAATMLIDAMSTLKLAGLDDEFDLAVKWLSDKRRFNPREQGQRTLSFFELNIRVTGGLISAYALSGNKKLLDLAEEFAEGSLSAFPTGAGSEFPMRHTRMFAGRPGTGTSGHSLATVGTFQVEWRALSFFTGNEKWARIADNVSDHLHDLAMRAYPGLTGVWLHKNGNRWESKNG
uniref:alpha-1,2-Mannosidase n=1 Tax=Chromera velia CCMP2878 TaxID=1169474 RepID=A0A0G4IA69_9ALVE|eukprot:Cvel_12472.t1-p1 / transcript=Cvel_12472.t1 / gene=Cvel_12472 / organism=Chromera_velia_CCMP2878 / gene_product=Endoplasmic reticulum mannosyl-oligosaccharide, putative / transcript_product=Endoplasmic reticulum mannosyl-oligosaccharide, putative / location=Cvel_scaffold817:62793-65887(+) / protein_length=319 / sequence_SO=supercontig / SO=protein_coding / is_pseudo=false